MAGVLRDLTDRLAPWRAVVLAAAMFVLASNAVVLATEADEEPAAGAVASTGAAAATPLDPGGALPAAPAPEATDGPEAGQAPAAPAAPAPGAAEPSAAAPESAPAPSAPPADGPWSLEPYRGLGAWIDVYDWSVELTGGKPTVGVADIDDMARQGVQTIYIQTGHRRSGADIVDHQRQVELIERAQGHGMYVVGWYLPMLEDPDADVRRMVAAIRELPLDGFGVDIESVEVGDVAERNRRLLAVSVRLRAAVGPGRALSAITPSAVQLQVVNPGFWPEFPWADLVGAYDVFQPMAYWSVRRTEWRQGERYTAENIDRIRAATGVPDLPVHPVGGIADGASVPDVVGMMEASSARGALGMSLYDWRTSNPDQWSALAPIRR